MSSNNSNNFFRGKKPSLLWKYCERQSQTRKYSRNFIQFDCDICGIKRNNIKIYYSNLHG